MKWQPYSNENRLLFIMLFLLTNQQNGVIVLLTRQQNVLRREVKCLYLDHKMKGKLKKA